MLPAGDCCLVCWLGAFLSPFAWLCCWSDWRSPPLIFLPKGTQAGGPSLPETASPPPPLPLALQKKINLIWTAHWWLWPSMNLESIDRTLWSVLAFCFPPTCLWDPQLYRLGISLSLSLASWNRWTKGESCPDKSEVTLFSSLGQKRQFIVHINYAIHIDLVFLSRRLHKLNLINGILKNTTFKSSQDLTEWFSYLQSDFWSRWGWVDRDSLQFGDL